MKKGYLSADIERYKSSLVASEDPDDFHVQMFLFYNVSLGFNKVLLFRDVLKNNSAGSAVSEFSGVFTFFLPRAENGPSFGRLQPCRGLEGGASSKPENLQRRCRGGGIRELDPYS